MTWFLYLLFGLVLIFSVSIPSALACTAFQLQNEKQTVCGRNYDWFLGEALIIINKKNIAKTGLLPNAKPLKWTSKYASISLNQHGKDLPLEGMNEQGLVIASLILYTTEYEQPDLRLPVHPSVWIQYQLDTSANVKDVIENRQKLRLGGKTSVGLHFFVCDRHGDAVVIEFIKGKPVYHTGKNLPIPAITNNTYIDSMSYFKADKTEKTKLLEGQSGSSLERFDIAAKMLTKIAHQGSTNIGDNAFNILSSVKKGNTQWSIVYDTTNLIVHIKTQKHPALKSVRLHDFHLSCNTPEMVLDVNTSEQADISKHFTPYSTEINRKLIYSVYKKTPSLKGLPDNTLESLSKWPDSQKCTEEADKNLVSQADVKYGIILSLFIIIMLAIVIAVYRKRKA